MKFLAPLLTFATAVCAQSISISVPADGARLTAGQQTTVEVDRPNFQSFSQEVSIAIGIVSCTPDSCPPLNDLLGTRVLYHDNYNPQPHTSDRLKPPHQNATITIPSNFQKGPAQLRVAHFTLVGAGFSPVLETRNVSVVIQ